MNRLKRAAIVIVSISPVLIGIWLVQQDYYYENKYPESVWIRDISFHSGDITLRGRLVGPAQKDRKPLPGVVILHGTNPEGSGLFLYRVLSEELAKRGSIVFLYDQRGYGKTDDPPKNKRGGLNLSFVSDAVKAVNVLRSQPEVDPRRIILAGHSFGGSVAVGVAFYKDVENILTKIVIISPGRGWPYKGEQRYAFRQKRLSHDMKLPYMIDKEDIKSLFAELEVETLVMKHAKVPVVLVNGAHEERLKPLMGIYTKISSPKSIFIVESTGHYFGTNSYFNRLGLPVKIYDREKLHKLVEIILN